MKKSFLVIMLLVMALTLSACGSQPAAPAKPAEPPKPAFDAKTLTIGIGMEYAGSDPAVVYDNNSSIILCMYETLVTVEKGTNKIIPQLAKEWTISSDQKVYTFKLRENVKFHDGTTLDAESVKLSLERILKVNKGPAWMFQKVWQTIEAVDPLTVKITLIKPDSAFLAKLAGAAGPQIISAKAIKEKSGDDNGMKYFNENEAGTGPYKLSKWDRGQQVVLGKFDGYWGGWSGKHVETIVWKYVKEASSQLMLLEKGELDVAPGLPADTIMDLNKTPKPGIKIVTGQTQNILSLVMNTQKGPLKDKRVRQAIAYAIDYDGLIKSVWGNVAYVQMIGFLPNTDPFAWKDAWPYKLDLEKSKSLLAAAGYGKGFTLKLGLSANSAPFKAIAEVAQANLKKVGVEVQIESLQWATLYKQEEKVDTAFDLLPIGNYPDYNDPTSILGNQFASWAWGVNGWNFSFYKNTKVDKALDDALLTTDLAKRTQLFKDVQTILTDEMPLVPIGVRKDNMVMKDYVQGYYARPLLSNSYPVYEMYKEAATPTK